jgi:hypothetical protein
MRRWGISVYLENGSLKETLDYITLAGEMGFSRIFTCLLSVPTDRAQIKIDFRTMIDHAHRYGMEVIADVAPRVFHSLGITYQDLSFFAEIGADGIRLDEGFTGNEEALMTFNPQGLKIELNISSGTRYLENILSYQADPHRLMGCHNFYPKLYSGLARDYLIETTLPYKRNALTTAAFVNASSASFGPWSLTNGLCTLEDHRHLPIDVQAKDLFYTGLIDDVIVGNAFAVEAELKLLRSVEGGLIVLDVELLEEVLPIEKEILFGELHFYRGDKSAYSIRSCEPRVKFSSASILPHHTKPIKRGDVIVQNDFVPRYKGEVHIALREMENDGSMNVLGRLSETNLRFLPCIQAWTKFRLNSVPASR